MDFSHNLCYFNGNFVYYGELKWKGMFCSFCNGNDYSVVYFIFYGHILFIVRFYPQ